MSVYDKASKRVDTGGLFIKLQAGKKVRIRILDLPYVSSRVFPQSPEPKTLFSWPVWDYESESIKILQKGPSIFTQLKEIISEYGEETPMDCDLIITTTGQQLQTRYSVVPGRISQELPAGWEKDMPDMDVKIKGGIPLEAFGGGKDPVTQKSNVSDEDYQSDQPPIDTYDESEALGQTDSSF